MSDNKDNEDDFDFDFDDDEDFDPDLEDDLDDLDADFDDTDEDFVSDFDDEDDFDSSEPLESTKDKISPKKRNPANTSGGSMLNKAIIGVAVLFAGAIGWTVLSGDGTNQQTQNAQIIDPSAPPPALDFGNADSIDPDMLPDNRFDEGVSLPMPVPMSPAEEEVFEEPKTLASLDEELAIEPAPPKTREPVGLPPMPAAESNVVVPEAIEENIDIASLEALKPKTPETSIMDDMPPMPKKELTQPALEQNDEQIGMAFEVSSSKTSQKANQANLSNEAIEKMDDDFSSKIENLNKRILDTQTEMAITSGKLERQSERHDKRLDTIEKSVSGIQKSLSRMEDNLAKELKDLVKNTVAASPKPATVPLRASTPSRSAAPAPAPVKRQETATKVAPQQIIKPLIPKRKASYSTKSIAIDPAPAQRAPTSSIKWVLRAASPGEAVVAMQGSNDLTSIKVGSTLPGIGQIRSISQQNGIWIVQGTTGKITR